ncbi:MAG: PD-(D/E)XK nuclease family protein [Thaumarchaeota archaeon]|nr:PD-(D/E)XK nuclease family protein [Nitrososphaerota archaeon]
MSDVGEEVVEGVNKGLRNLWRQEADLHQPKTGSYYPSMIGACLRKQYYAYSIGEVPDDGALAIFATGRGVHDAVADALDNSGVLKVEAREVEVSLPFGEAVLHGRIDLVVASLRGEKIAIEVKSTSRIPEEPFEHQVLQLQTYLHATGLGKGVLLYWDKRHGAKKGFVIEKERLSLEKLEHRVGALHKSLVSKEPPPREAFLENRLWECRYCSFLSTCKPFQIEGLETGPIAVYDLDNTLLDSRDRLRRSLRDIGLSEDTDLKRLSAEDRKRFWGIYLSEKHLGLDKPIGQYVEKLCSHSRNNVVIVTGRPERLRAATEQQLGRLNIPFRAMVMRRDDEYLSDRQVKLNWVENLLLTGYTVEECVSSYRDFMDAAKILSEKYRTGSTGSS